MMKTRSVWGAILLAPQILLISCVSDNICGKEMIEKDGKCAKPKDTSWMDSASIDSDADSESDQSNDAGVEPPPGMGDPCTESANCTGATDYCIQENAPADPNGYCTISGCTLDPDNCPETYICIDLSQYFASLPMACAKRRD